MTKAFYLDLLERVIWTFVQGFLGAWLVTGDFDGTALKIGVVAGAVSVAKCLLAVNIGHGTAAAVPGQPYEYDDAGQSTLAIIVAVVLVVLLLKLLGVV